MSEPESTLANAVLSRNLKVKKGESVVIEAWTHALPYVRAFVREARRLGAHPTVLYEEEDAWWDAVKSKQLGSFQKLSAAERETIASADVFLYFWGPSDRPRMWELPESTQGKVTGANEEWYKVARKAGLRGCRMSVGQASDPSARFFGLDGETWRSRLVAAGSEDLEVMRKKGERVVKSLSKGSELRIRHANGTDLTVQLKGLHTRIDVGDVTRSDMKRPYGMLSNNPSGQVMVAVDASNASGDLVSNRSIYLGQHRYGGIHWTFESGRLTDHSMDEGRVEFEAQYAKAGKGKDRLGYLSIGLNPSSRDLPPCEDTEEGAVLVGVGNNGFVGGKIRLPFQMYSLLGEAKLEVDGKILGDRGRLG